MIAHVAVIQKDVDGNQNVVRKLLPSPIGTQVTLPFTTAEGERMIDPGMWVVDLPSLDAADAANFAIAAWLQDEFTHEVYQATLELNPLNLPSIVTGTENLLQSRVTTYPNPADSEVKVVLSEAMAKDTEVRLFDNFGKAVASARIPKGQRTQIIRTKELAAGVYLMQLDTPEGRVMKKVIVVHN
jgi:hypothetical protein